MSKRELDIADDDRPPKRPRPTKPVFVDQPVERIASARHLQGLLIFNQSDNQQLRHGISSCKAFLEEIVYHQEDVDRLARIALLKEYLSLESPQDISNTDRPFFTQLWQAWSFANSNNNDHLASAVCSLFALLLKTISSLVDFAEYGKLLCRTILQTQHLRLIKRCLDAPKHKEFLLSPSLRLLTEITTFEGGIFANEVYKKREQTFDVTALRKCLAVTRSATTDIDLKRRPAVRTLAVRYILLHLRLQSEGGKIDILKQRQLCITLFSYFRNDPAELILEILKTTESQVFKHSDLPRASKASLLSQQHLERVIEIATRAEISEDVTNEALRWLRAVCTTPSYGVLLKGGWYPQGSTHVDTRSGFDRDTIDLGLRNLAFWENEDKFQVKNSVLAAWIRTLHPNSDLRERELVLACFSAAPELVFAYFKDDALQMDPKLTNTWLGYASFLFEVTALPIPINAGHIDSSSYATLPPQTNIVRNNILPKPLTQKILSRCLNQNENLISYFIVRLLCTAIDKFQLLRKEYQKAITQTQQPELWKEALQQLDSFMITTLPAIKDVLNLFRGLPDDNQHSLQREATLKLLKLYITALPIVDEESVDVSSALVAVLARDGQADTASWNKLELQHLIEIAQHSADMRWFQKQKGLSDSPFVAILRLCLRDGNQDLKELAQSLLEINGILASNKHDDGPVFTALLTSLEVNDNPVVWDIFEQYLGRATKAPVKYLDDLDELDTTKSSLSSILLAVVKEQAKFVVNKEQPDRLAVMKWINTLLYCWSQTSERHTSELIKLDVSRTPGWDTSSVVKIALQQAVHAKGDDTINATVAPLPVRDPLLHLTGPPQESLDHPELLRWQKKDLDQAFEDEDIDKLILCLCSGYDEVRKQACVQLEALMISLQMSDLDDKEQLYLLIGELLETNRAYRQQNSPLPYLVGTFATHSIYVEMEPTHYAYPKLNKYLMKSPEWQVSKITSYWLGNTSLSMPADDDSYWNEIHWVLDWIVDGLRTQADLELLRKAGSLERLISLHSSPGASEKLIKQKVMEIIYRAAVIDATTLVTRTGVLSWLRSLKGDLPKALRRFIIDKTDGSRLKTWSGAEISL